MLKTENQYKFACDTITYYMETVETEIDVNEINDYINQKSETNSKQVCNQISYQYSTSRVTALVLKSEMVLL